MGATKTRMALKMGTPLVEAKLYKFQVLESQIKSDLEHNMYPQFIEEYELGKMFEEWKGHLEAMKDIEVKARKKANDMSHRFNVSGIDDMHNKPVEAFIYMVGKAKKDSNCMYTSSKWDSKVTERVNFIMKNVTSIHKEWNDLKFDIATHLEDDEGAVQKLNLFLKKVDEVTARLQEMGIEVKEHEDRYYYHPTHYSYDIRHS